MPSLRRAVELGDAWVPFIIGPDEVRTMLDQRGNAGMGAALAAARRGALARAPTRSAARSRPGHRAGARTSREWRDHPQLPIPEHAPSRTTLSRWRRSRPCSTPPGRRRQSEPSVRVLSRDCTAVDHDAGELDARVDAELLVDLSKVGVDGVARHKEPTAAASRLDRPSATSAARLSSFSVQALPAKPSRP